jgi:hypothetical protein
VIYQDDSNSDGMSLRMFETDFAFPHSYEVTDPPELAGSGMGNLLLYFYPPPMARPERDGAWIRCRPQYGAEWVGVFADEYPSPPAIYKIFSTPNPDRLLVVSGGSGYAVTSSNPSEWEIIPIFPITYAVSVPDHRFLVFGGFSDLLAWNGSVVWKTRLAVDGLTVTSLTSDRIKGYGYDPALGADDPFVIATASGNHY